MNTAIPTNLPIADKADEIIASIKRYQVTVIAGETGSGKTTQIPKLCLQAGCAGTGMIGHTQPRRLAATTVAQRIAEECGVGLGEAVGYQVRFNDKTSEDTVIKLMTDGILLNEIQFDKSLSRYDTLIIDEAHERSLNIDFILGFLKRLLPQRPELKVIITSATIDVARFSQHFEQAPIIEVSGRCYPVDTHYLDPLELNQNSDNDLALTSVSALEYIFDLERQGSGHQHGDVLIFLPGERDIRDASLAIKKAQFPHVEVLPLYARLSHAEQQRIFKPHAKRRIVLATNVAETSLTVPGIRYVIDSGLARISRYSSRSKVQRLPVERISQASANQRQGRCGRTAPGTCLRLYTEQDYAGRAEFTPAEIMRTNLAAVILQMMHLRLGKIEDFPFIDKPQTRYIKDGLHLLTEIGAIDASKGLTSLGRQMARLPLDPRLSRMVLSASRYGCLQEVLIIVSGLACQDPRERPADKEQQATQAHARFNASHSDFLAILKLWDYHEQLRQELSQNQLRKRLQKEFLSYLRLREWRAIHRQLMLTIKPLKLTVNLKKADKNTIHRSLLSGLLSHIGEKKEKRTYAGTRNREFHLFPGSSLYQKPPPWIMSAELLETSKLYARTNGEIEPEWLLDYASHLIRKTYYEPAWSSRSGHVMAYCRTSLYGLTIQDKKRVTYSKIDPQLCHQLFIRQALVERGYERHQQSLPSFWQHNQNIINEISKLEEKSRRRDILVDEEQIHQFYARRIPEEINNLTSFEQWRKQEEQSNPEVLYFDKAELMQHAAAHINQAQYPEVLTLDKLSIPLSYHFEPQHPDDGVTATIALNCLNQITPQVFEYLVPGLLAEKCIEIMKGLPKPIRKQLVPIPDFIHNALAQLVDTKQSLYDFLSHMISCRKGITVSPAQLRTIELDAYYRMNFHIIDENRQLIAQGRDWQQLLKQCQPHIKHVFKHLNKVQETSQKYMRWDFGGLGPKRVRKNGIELLAYPALKDCGDAVCLELFADEVKARRYNRQGVIKLLELDLTKSVSYLKKQLFKESQSRLLLRKFNLGTGFIEDFVRQIIDITFLSSALPLDETAFKACIKQHQGDFMVNANTYESLLLTTFQLRSRIDQSMEAFQQSHFKASLADITQQMAGLFNPDFLSSFAQLKHYPRYLKAIVYRLERLSHNPKESINLKTIVAFERRLLDVIVTYAELTHHLDYQAYRWLLEEYRVSLFAQHLGTAEPVSPKRLDKAWTQIAGN